MLKSEDFKISYCFCVINIKLLIKNINNQKKIIISSLDLEVIDFIMKANE